VNSRLLAGLVALAVVAGVLALRERTMTRHEPGRPGTATEVVVRARVRGATPRSAPDEFAAALLLACRLEVDAEPAGPMERPGPGVQRYRLVLEPALDEFDERRLHGCLEDARLDHVQLEVVSLRPLPAA